MRVKINGLEVDGNLEEVAALIRMFGGSEVTQNSEEIGSDRQNYEESERFASEKIAFRALRRRPLSNAQRDLFRTLLKAYPNWVSSTELQKATSYGPNQLGGLLGAIGRRLSQTDGYVRNTTMIEWSWNTDENEYAYRLPAAVAEAVRRIDP